jgi:D-alanine--poly(phosphoribitol) ligase subunit 1
VTVFARFRDIATQQPEQAALRPLDGPVVSYAELLHRAERIAGGLSAAGVGRRDPVAMEHDKTPAAYACQLACLRLGAPVVCLDPANPLVRRERILDQCRPRVVVRAGHYPSFEVDAPQVPAIDEIHGCDPAYIMFTSGSTGFPKGAAIAGQALLRFVDWIGDELRVTRHDRFTGVNPLHFDNAISDTWVSLLHGASLVPIPDALLMQPRKVVRRVTEAGCSIWFSVPSLLVYALRLRAFQAEDLPDLRTMIFGGEALPKSALRQLWQLYAPRLRFLNVYGPTEATCMCSARWTEAADLQQDGLLPLGRLAPLFQGLIVDERLLPVAEGEAGELCLLGEQLTLGYWNDPERTATALVENPCNPHYRERMYRTGDLVRRDPNSGELHFLGRRDHQIKHMGHRLELTEIDIALQDVPGVQQACAVYLPAADGPGRLIACVQGEIDEAELRLACRERLPAYAVPSEWYVWPQLPRNRNGKVDRRACADRCDEGVFTRAGSDD